MGRLKVFIAPVVEKARNKPARFQSLFEHLEGLKWFSHPLDDCVEKNDVDTRGVASSPTAVFSASDGDT